MKDAEIFFGRSREIESFSQIILSSTQYLQIQGGSGAGKSSLVYAGILPVVCRADGKSRFVGIKPGNGNPFVPLARSLRGGDDEDGHIKYADRISADFEMGLLAINQKLEELNNDFCRIIVVDQLEEMLMANDDGTIASLKQKKLFVQFLKYFIDANKVNKVITTIREDRGDLLNQEQWRPLVEIINNGRTIRLLAPDIETGLSEIILKPAERADFEVCTKLIDKIREDVVNERYWPPLVSLALEQVVFEYEEAALTNPCLPRKLTLDMYRRVGGIDGVISKITRNFMEKHVNTIEKKKDLEDLFCFLVNVDDSGSPVKARLNRSALDKDLGSLAGEMVRRRLLADEGQIEIIHDRLFEAWPILKEWIEERKEEIDELNDITRQALRWDRKKDRSLLLNVSRIEKAEYILAKYPKWKKAHPLIDTFVKDSRVEVDRQKLIDSIPKADFSTLFRLIENNKRLSRRDVDNPEFYYALYPDDLINHRVVNRSKTLNVGETAADIGAIKEYFTEDALARSVASSIRVSHYAAFAGKIHLLEHIDSLEPDLLRAESDTGKTPVFHAAMGGHVETLTWFLQRFREIDPVTLEDRGGVNLMYCAAMSGKLDVIECLYKLGVPIDKSCSRGWAPLLIAAYFGYQDVIFYLLEKNADVFIRSSNNENFFLFLAVNGHLNALKEIVESDLVSKSDIKKLFSQEGHEFNVLAATAQKQGVKCEDIVRLVQLGADPTEPCRHKQKTALHLVIKPFYNVNEDYSFKRRVIRELLENGGERLNLEAVDEEKQTVLYLAIKEGYLEIIKLLLDAGASPFSLIPAGDKSILQWLRQEKESIEALKVIVNHPVITQVTTENDGWTAAMYAAKAEDQSRLREILDGADIDVNFVAQDGNSLGVLLVRSRMIDMAWGLISKQELNPWFEGVTDISMLAVSINMHEFELANKILDLSPASSHSNKQNILNRSLKAACKMPAQSNLVKRLLELGAVAGSMKDKAGDSPLFTAATFGAVANFELMANSPNAPVALIDDWGRCAADVAPLSVRSDIKKIIKDVLSQRGA